MKTIELGQLNLFMFPYYLVELCEVCNSLLYPDSWYRLQMTKLVSLSGGREKECCLYYSIVEMWINLICWKKIFVFTFIFKNMAYY